VYLQYITVGVTDSLLIYTLGWNNYRIMAKLL